MGSLLWIVIALAIVSILVYVVSVQKRARLPEIQLPPGEKLPKTHMQRYAGWTLLEIGFLTFLAAGIVAFHGPEVWWDDAAALVVYGDVVLLLATVRTVRSL